MLLNIDPGVVDWSRAQFALTAMYHWLFVPLTLGLSILVAIMETIYVKTGDPEWKRITKFWMTLFGINFAIGIATGIILEFEFGTNWSNYSWFVGDIFGAPLAIEAIMSFFLESTFIAVMFFGWNKVSKRFHLVSSWLTAIGANLSALWILVANAWMQYPVGMKFNPLTARNEMQNFWDVLFSPVAIPKFLHTVSSGYVTAAIFILGISAWYLLKKRETEMALKSIRVAAIFGLITSLFLAFTGDGSGFTIAQKQPMKLAAMEGLYHGQKSNGLVLFGIPQPGKKAGDGKRNFVFKVEIPGLLSLMGYRKVDAFVPGVEDILHGGFKPEFQNVPLAEKESAFPVSEKIIRGKRAISAFVDFRKAHKAGDEVTAAKADSTMKANFRYFGYGYLKSPDEAVPNVPLTFYSFRTMVIFGFYFILLFVVVLAFLTKDQLQDKRWLQYVMLWTIPIVYLAGQAGWIVTEVGRQPWAIQDLLPTRAAVSMIDITSVQVTFWMFAALFTTLLIAEVMIMTRQIKLGPKDGGTR